MHLPRPRFTLRRLMVAVAIVAIIIGVVVEGERRRARFRELAANHYERGMRWFVLFGGESDYQRNMMQLWEERVGPTVEYHATLRDKYEQAARYPWLPVGADPTAPPEPATSYPWLPIEPEPSEPE
jgi:hypothetical protein